MPFDCDDFEEMCNGSGLADEKEGCYIATAVYGSYDCPEVWILRRFRDGYLKQHRVGRTFIKCYYALSPILVARFGHIKWLHNGVRKILNRFVMFLKQRGYSNKPYHDKIYKRKTEHDLPNHEPPVKEKI